MQIHELDNFEGSLNQGAFLAVDDGNDTGKVSVPQILAEADAAIGSANARIDNLLSGLTVDSEVIDARVGADGNTYPSLGAAVRTQFDELHEQTDNIWINAYGTFYGVTFSPNGDGGIKIVGTADTTENVRATLPAAVTLSGYRLQYKQTQNLSAGSMGLRLRNSSYTSLKYLETTGTSGAIAGSETLSVKYLDIKVIAGKVYDNVLYISLTNGNAEKEIVPRLVTPDFVARKALEDITPLFSTENPLQPLLFKNMAWAKGSTAFTDVGYASPKYLNDDLGGFNAAAESQTLNYAIFAYEFSENSRIDKLTSSAKKIEDLVFVIKSNKPFNSTIYLSMGQTWGGAGNSTCMGLAQISNGVSVINPKFEFINDNHADAKYRYFVMTLPKYNDLEFEMYALNNNELYTWITNITDGRNANADLLCWGDSLTAGAGGGGTNYPDVCAAELGISVLNCGVGGETANTIAARQGGNNLIIPAGPVNGTYTLSQMNDVFKSLIAPIRQGNGQSSGNILYINGESCSLTISQQSVTDPDAVYTISGYTGGTSPMALLAKFAGSDFSGRIVTIFVGTNGYEVDGDTSVDALISIIDSMVAHVGHDRYVIMGLSNGNTSTRADIDAAMLKHYGAKFFPTRMLLVENGLEINNITPTADDLIYISTGTVPESLRTDSTHLNAAGYTALGKLLADKIRSLGYV